MAVVMMMMVMIVVMVIVMVMIVGMLMVVVANLADVLLELHYIRDAVIVAFCANECISILENAGLMGIRIPKVLTVALEKLGEERDHEPGT